MADIPIGEAVDDLDATDPRYLVVRRQYRDEVLDYAYTAEEVRGHAVGMNPDTPLIYALKLHETDASPHRSPQAPLTPPAGSVTKLRGSRIFTSKNDYPGGNAGKDFEPTNVGRIGPSAVNVAIASHTSTDG